MKKSYKKMIIFQSLILLIFILNSFVSNILRGYNFAIFLIVGLVLFKFFFGFERDRNRYTKDVIFDMIIFLIIFFILYYILGIFIGFAKVDNYYNWYGLKTFILPLTLTIVFKEILRYMMLKKCEENKFLLVLTTILFIFLDVTEAVYYNDFKSAYNTFIFIALTLLPAISSNVMCSYLSQRSGYKPAILYLLITKLYVYLIPIIPNPNEYITSIVNLGLPIIYRFRVNSFFDKDSDEEINRDYKKKSILPLIVPVILIAFIVYFTSGYFTYFAVAIASGSMEPVISKGDVVIIKKIEDNYNTLKKGQVLVFEYNKVTVVHRIINIEEEDGKYFFYTKGDANNSPDNYVVTEDMVVGTTSLTLPYLGLPTVWLNEM